MFFFWIIKTTFVTVTKRSASLSRYSYKLAIFYQIKYVSFHNKQQAETQK